MTTGALIFAFDNEQIDYLAMANWSAKRIRHYLDLPVCVVTNKPVPDDYVFEHVIQTQPKGQDTRDFHDVGQRVTWYNGNRSDVYELTPWDSTLVLDADYVVSSNALASITQANLDFVCHKTAYDVTGLQDFDDHNGFGRNLMPMWWATVMMFRRSQQAELIFGTMQMIRKNWNHYRNLYGVAHATFRNDYALSMALSIVNGHGIAHAEIPWRLATVTHDHTLKQIDQDRFRVEFTNPSGKNLWTQVTGDFHAMGKRHLGDIIANPA
jgi:hypothetical protein